MKIKLVSFFLIFGITVSFGQYKQMLHKSYNDKVSGIGALYHNVTEKGKTDTLFISKYTKEMEQWALSHKDKELALEAKLLRYYSLWRIYGHEDSKYVQDLISFYDDKMKGEVYHIDARTVFVIANHYWYRKNYESAFEWLLQLNKVLEGIEPNKFPDMSNYLNFIGRSYYHFEDYTQALVYFKKSANLPKSKFNAKEVLGAKNTVGLCYQKLGNLKLAKPYFLEVIEDTSAYRSTVWKGIASGNLGYNYYLENNYEKAIPLFKIDIENAIAINDLGLAAGSLIPLADIYLKKNNLIKAKEQIDSAYSFIHKSNQKDRLRKLYPLMSKLYAANNKLQLSSLYLDSTLIAINNYNIKYNSLKLLKANQKVQEKELELEVRVLKSANKLKLTQRNFVIVIIVILLIASLVSLWASNKYLLRKQQIKELALENTQKEYKIAKDQLENLTAKIREDNQLIADLQKEKDSKNNLKLLTQLKSKYILTQNDWVQFQKIFNDAYPLFITELVAKYPNLSQAEIRCLCLVKLHLNNTEMSLVLGVSSNTIRVTKHRIRKKLEIVGLESLEKLVQNL